MNKSAMCVSVLALAAALGFTPAAQANTYTYTFGGHATIPPSSFSMMGTLTGTAPDFDMTGDTGTFSWTTQGMSGVTFVVQAANLTVGATNFANNNMLYTGAGTTAFDMHGILLKIMSGADAGDYVLISETPGKNLDVVLYSSAGTFLSGVNYNSPSLTISGGIITSTPEPSTLSLLGSGLLGLALMAFWRIRRAKHPLSAASFPA